MISLYSEAKNHVLFTMYKYANVSNDNIEILNNETHII